MTNFKLWVIRMVLPIVVLSSGTVFGDVMIDDFEAGSNVDWDYLSDQVMGGVSEGSARLGRDENEAYAHMTGDVSTANNGGFIQLRTSLKSGADKNTKGVFIKVRG
ncbi:MAG: NADH ubiquinone oxidoreductase, partial [Porticoccaceae bacterium]|nr:NADH ubiquinone oxidoreductase [Porticoccaceae bacterium]